MKIITREMLQYMGHIHMCCSTIAFYPLFAFIRKGDNFDLH